jgi:hypothetical protein
LLRFQVGRHYPANSKSALEVKQANITFSAAKVQIKTALESAV